MALKDEIESISKISQSDGGDSKESPLDLAKEVMTRNRFDDVMAKESSPAFQQSLSTQEIGNAAGQKPSLFDTVKDIQSRVDHLHRANPQDLVAQANEAIQKIESVKHTLATSPDLQLRGSLQSSMKNSLSHIDENLKIALSKAGVEYNPNQPVAGNEATNPIERFLGFLTHGQSSLENLTAELSQAHLKKGEISPADMLSVQIKIGYIQNEIDFFTTALNKFLESTKTVLNVQV